MKKPVCLLLITLLSAPLYKACGDEAVPAEPQGIMGDWQGTIEGSDEEIVAQIIARGGGAYEAKLFPQFDTRTEPITVLSGHKRNDSVAFESELYHGMMENGVLAGGEKKQEEAMSFKMEPVERLSPTLGKDAPEDAIVLFDGSDLNHWQKVNTNEPTGWKLVSGGSAMEVVKKSGSVESKEQFNDFTLHLEFRTPFLPDKDGQKRGNSGLYLQGRYELQILDSYGLEGLDNECGGIYKISAPRVNMCAPPLQWQTYDVDFKAARFNEEGEKLGNAVVTVLHNGVPIHENLELPAATPGGKTKTETPEPGPILLQDHGDPVQFRNIWIIDKNKTQKDKV